MRLPDITRPLLLMAIFLGFMALKAIAQTNVYLFSGHEVNIALNPGVYYITAYGAQGGDWASIPTGGASDGAEMEGQFRFATNVNLTLLVGGAGGGGEYFSGTGAGGGGGGSFVVNGSTPLVVAGGGGGGGYNGGGGGSITPDGGTGGGYFPDYGGAGGSDGAGGSYASSNCGGGGGGGFSGNGSGDSGFSFGGGGGNSFLNGGGGGGAAASNIGGNGGYGGGGGGGEPDPSGDSHAEGGGAGGGYSGGGGGSGGAGWGGGGGGSYIDSSALADITEINTGPSPDGSPNGEIIIESFPTNNLILLTQPSSQAAADGQTATFSVSAMYSPPFSYQWLFNGTNIADATNATYSISNVQSNNDGAYSVVVSDAVTNVSSSNAILTVDYPVQIIAQPTNLFLFSGSNAVFTVTATGTISGYQWYFNGAPLTDGGNVSGSMSPTLTLANAQPNNSGNYAVVITNAIFSSASSNATLTVINPIPAIVSPPANEAVAAGSNAVFSIYATNYYPLSSFQWLFNGTNLTDGGQISGSASSNLVISSAQDANDGPYQVIVSDNYGAITSSPVSLTVYDPVQITGQPASETVLAGSNATFAVTATGTALNYQWSFNGNPLTDGGNISGSATPTLNITSAQTANAGGYTVMVTNLFSSALSSNATLTVYNPAQITVQPVNIGVLPGKNGSFTVAATGTALGYQWSFMGMPLTDGGQISGSATPTLNISDVQSTNLGAYTVAITNLFSATNSLPASLFSASIRYVNLSNKTPLSPYTNWSSAATDIQSAINVSTLGDVIMVTNGVYQTDGETVSSTATTNRVAITQPITVESVNGPAVTMIEGYQVPVVISSNNAVRCVYMTNNSALIGFTLTNGAIKAFDLGGGGVSCQSTACIISNCVIVGNSSFSDGGGAYLGTLLNCTLLGNSIITSQTIRAGGGAYESHLANCVVANNSANGGTGGGIYGGSAVNCTITGNSASEGGGAGVANLTNCIVYYNYASFTSGNVTNYFSGTLAYCCTTPAPGGTGNITNVPLLVGISEIASNSPCRGAGYAAATSGVDINGNPWANPPSIGCEEPYPGSMFANLNVGIGVPWTNDPVGYPMTLQANISGPAYNSIWNFGDGTIVTNVPYVSHTWPALGVYPVTLTAYNDSYPTGQTVTLNVNVYQPTTFYVVFNTNQVPVAPYDTWAKAATIIQNAINVSVPNGLILVSNGVYNSGSTRDSDGGTSRVAVTQPLTIESVNGPSVTAINGNNQFRCVYLTNGAVLSGFTLTNGNTANGAGAYSASTNALVANCLLIRNVGGSAAYSGTVSNCTLLANSGYGAQNSTLLNCLMASNIQYGAYLSVLDNCLVCSNLAGGGTYMCALYNCVISNNNRYGIYQSAATDCKIINNFQQIDATGAGAYNSELTNCLIYGNRTVNAGGGAAFSTLVNCTVVTNLASNAGGVLTCQLFNCIVYGNFGSSGDANWESGNINFCCTTPLPSGPGNITNIPAFVNLAAGDFHLQSNSPCINSGNNAYIWSPTDFDGNPRIVGGTVDMGAYEYQTPTSVISYAYLQQYGLPTDGSVDFADLDGTPFNVYQDWIAGLNPTNPASVLVMLSPPATNNALGITVSWESVNGINYNLLSATNLMSAFTTIKSNIVGQAGATSYTDTTATNGGPYFYRVAVP